MATLTLMLTPTRARTAILARCRDLGFALAGVCRAGPTVYRDGYLRWIAEGRHGEMQYLARNIEQRLDPRVLVAGARSIICVADRYHIETPKRQNAAHRRSRAAATPKLEAPSTLVPFPLGEGKVPVGADVESRSNALSLPAPLPGREGSQRGRIARYARGDDYHLVMKKRLRALADELRAMFPQHVFRACVDTAPVLEREHAQRAGLGAVGKNTLLIQRGVGSYILLGEIITTLEIAPNEPAPPDPCGSCTRCIDACPTGAIVERGWLVDATKCISYLTIEHRGTIDPKYHEAMGDWVFGCDICQEVCPHNQPTGRSSHAEVNSAYAPRQDSFDLLAVLNWTEDERRAAFTRSSMKRAKLHMMKRNATIATRNLSHHESD